MDRVELLLRKVTRAAFLYPTATRAAFAALEAEGRRFAETPEGARLAQELRGSALLSRAQVALEALAGYKEPVHSRKTVPSEVLDAFVFVVATGPLESMISRVLDKEEDGENCGGTHGADES